MTRHNFYRKKNKKKGLIIFFTVLLLLCCGVLLFTVYVIQPVINTVSQETLKSYTYETVNKSVSEVLDKNPDFLTLTEIVRNDSGDITLIQTNSAVANNLARNVTEQAQINLSKICDIGIKIPIGSLSGIPFLAGRGPDITIKSIQVANIDTSFSSQFLPAGINQTIHKFFVDVRASVNVIIPGSESKIVTLTQVLISENIIVGRVPNVYFGTQTPSSTLNLIP